MSQLYSVASFFLFLTETRFVLGDDELFNVLVRSVNDGVHGVVINPEDPELLWLAPATEIWRTVMVAHAQHGLGEDSGWILCHLYHMKYIGAGHVRGGRFARHERLRFRAMMANVHKRCIDMDLGGVIHRISLGGQIFWEGEYRPGEMRPHRVCKYEDGGGIRWILFERQLGQRKSR